MRGEEVLAAAEAAVLVYEETGRAWVAAAPGPGPSLLQLCRSPQLSFTLEGRRVQDQQLTLHCTVLPGLRYNQATPTFHQLRESGQVFGLHFAAAD